MEHRRIEDVRDGVAGPRPGHKRASPAGLRAEGRVDAVGHCLHTGGVDPVAGDDVAPGGLGRSDDAVGSSERPFGRARDRCVEIRVQERAELGIEPARLMDLDDDRHVGGRHGRVAVGEQDLGQGSEAATALPGLRIEPDELRRPVEAREDPGPYPSVAAAARCPVEEIVRDADPQSRRGGHPGDGTSTHSEPSQRRTTRAGFPTTSEWSGTSSVTTALAAT